MQVAADRWLFVRLPIDAPMNIFPIAVAVDGLLVTPSGYLCSVRKVVGDTSKAMASIRPTQSVGKCYGEMHHNRPAKPLHVLPPMQALDVGNDMQPLATTEIRVAHNAVERSGASVVGSLLQGHHVQPYPTILKRK